MATEASSSAKRSKKRKQVVLSIDRTIEKLGKCGFGVVIGRISVIQTFCLSEPLELAKGVRIIKVGLYILNRVAVEIATKLQNDFSLNAI